MYIDSLNGIEDLGSLSTELSKKIILNKKNINKVLQRADKLNGLGSIELTANPVIKTDEIIKKFNAGISKDEIKAWVWYRRSIGIPMYGWEKYYIDTKTGGKNEGMVYSIVETTIKDNYFRDDKVIPAKTFIGKQIGNKEHKGTGKTYIFVRASDGIKIVNKKDVDIIKSKIETDKNELERLIKVSALFYFNDELLPYAVYCFGNMYNKQLQLEKDKDYIIKNYGIKNYEYQLKIINDNKPKLLSIIEKNETDRPQISCISEYAKEYKISELRDDAGVIIDDKMTLQFAYCKWLETLGRQDFNENVNDYQIINYYIYARQLSRDMDKEIKKELRSNVRNEGERLFRRFLHECLTFNEQQKLDFDWNRKYNGNASVAVDKIPVGFSMSRKFKGFDLEIRPAQREAIAYMEIVGSGIIAYDVGVGKTISAIIELANALNSGKCERPLIVVPKPTYENWISETIGKKDCEGVLTNTGVTLNEWYNLGTKVLSKIDVNKQVPKKSITLITYEGLRKIGFSKQVGDNLFTELVNIFSQKSDEGRTQRNSEINYEKFWEKIGVGLKGTIADIDKIGFDYIVFDEAHKIKNVFNGVHKGKDGRKRFGASGGTSEIGLKAFFINNYLQRKYGRNIMLLTATPFTNSPLEIYSMLSHVAYDNLREMGYLNIEQFFEQFVLEQTVDVVNYKEEIEQKDVVKSFKNRLILQKLIYNNINYKTGEEVGIERPVKINLPKVSEKNKKGEIIKLKPGKQILTYLRMTDRQRINQNEITKLANQSSGRKGGANILKAMNMSLNNALSPYLYDHEDITDAETFVNESPKIKYTCECIKTVVDYHKKHNEKLSSQIVYSNRGIPFFHLIKEYLEKFCNFKKNVAFERVKLDEVEIIAGSSCNETKKENIIAGFNAGIVKVLIGSSTIREGLNLQKNTSTLYNLYPDWNPTDIRQLEGRVWRFGNKFACVRIVMPLVQDSMDVFVFQKIEEKTNRINDIWYKGDRGNVLDLDSLDPEEVKYALLSDIDAIANSILKKEIKEQQRKIDGIQYNIKDLNSFSDDYDRLKRYRENLNKAINNKISEFKTFDYIKHKLTKEELKKYDKDKRKLIENDIKLFNNVIELNSKIPVEDKVLLKIARLLSNRFQYFDDYYTSYFKEYLSRIKKAEKSILQPKGFSINDDIEKVINEYKKDLELANKELEFVNSKEHIEKVKNEVKQKKSSLKISGKTILDRVKEFSSLNNVLSELYNNISTKAENVKEEVKNIKDKNLKLLKLKAKALKLKLELLKI